MLVTLFVCVGGVRLRPPDEIAHIVPISKSTISLYGAERWERISTEFYFIGSVLNSLSYTWAWAKLIRVARQWSIC